MGDDRVWHLCCGTRLGLHRCPACLTERMLIFFMLHLALNDHSGRNASLEERDLSSSKILMLEAIPEEKFQKCVKQRKL